MPRPRSRYPSYRLHRPSGQAVVTIAGEDHYLGPRESEESLSLYDRLVMEWIAAGRPRHVRRSRDLTVAELCEAFWQYRKAKRQANGKPSGELAPFRSVIRLLRRRYGTLPVVRFRPKLAPFFEWSSRRAPHDDQEVDRMKQWNSGRESRT